MRYAALLLLASLIGGCMTRAEYIGYRDGLDRATSTIRAEHLEWSRALAGAPGALPLPDLSDETPAEKAAWLSAREGWHAEYRDFVEASRGNDGK